MVYLFVCFCAFGLACVLFGVCFRNGLVRDSRLSVLLVLLFCCLVGCFVCWCAVCLCGWLVDWSVIGCWLLVGLLVGCCWLFGC